MRDKNDALVVMARHSSWSHQWLIRATVNLACWLNHCCFSIQPSI